MDDQSPSFPLLQGPVACKAHNISDSIATAYTATIEAEHNLSQRPLNHQAAAASPAIMDIVLPRRTSPVRTECDLEDMAGEVVISREVQSLTTSDVVQSKSTSSRLQIDKGNELKATVSRRTPLQCLGADDEVQQDDDKAEQGTKTSSTQSPSKHLSIPSKRNKDKAAKEEEEEEEEEEEGCVTPRAREQSVIADEVLVCPAAPKKKRMKPSAFKRVGSNFYHRHIVSDEVAASSYNRQIDAVAEGRAFLVNPPDLHNFPECIRALFK